MKKLIVSLAVALAAIVAFAGDANQMFFLKVYPNQYAAGTTTNNETAASAVPIGLNCSQYKGNGLLLVSFGAGANAAVTSTVTLLHCATTNGTYATVTNIEGTAMTFTHAGTATATNQTRAIGTDRLSKYLRVTAAHDAANTNCVSVILVAPMKSE